MFLWGPEPFHIDFYFDPNNAGPMYFLVCLTLGIVIPGGSSFLPLSLLYVCPDPPDDAEARCTAAGALFVYSVSALTKAPWPCWGKLGASASPWQGQCCAAPFLTSSSGCRLRSCGRIWCRTHTTAMLHCWRATRAHLNPCAAHAP